MRKLGVAAAASFVAMISAACGAKVVVDDTALCIHFSDPERSVPNGPPPTNLACAMEPSLEARLKSSGNATSITPKASKWTRDLVCSSLDPNGKCPDAAAAAQSFTTCFASKTGEGCDKPLSGECDRKFVWSACGPDPSAINGCCYEVLVAESDVLS